MILQELKLTNYRNYDEMRLELSSGLNVISGDNAQGKTNLLEAIYYLGTLKSFRVRSEAELVRWGQEWAGISATFTRSQNQQSQLDVRWARNLKGRWERRVKRNGIVLNSLAEFLSEVPLSLFIPQDLALVQGGPDLRRRYLDVLLCKSSPSYLFALVRYQQVLKQRNEWWRQRGSYRCWRELEIWDEQLAPLAAKLVSERQVAVEKLSSIVSEVFSALASVSAHLELHYRSSLTDDVPAILESLRSKREEEMGRRVTLLGPHRDDVVIALEGRNFKQCASQGQHRSAALALRLAEALYMSEITDNPAIILLDDCFSELDQGRCRRLFDYLGDIGQVIITSVSRLDYRGATAVAEYTVSNGNIARLTASATNITGAN